MLRGVVYKQGWTLLQCVYVYESYKKGEVARKRVIKCDCVHRAIAPGELHITEW